MLQGASVESRVPTYEDRKVVLCNKNFIFLFVLHIFTSLLLGKCILFYISAAIRTVPEAFSYCAIHACFHMSDDHLLIRCLVAFSPDLHLWYSWVQ